MLMLVLFIAVLFGGVFAFRELNIEAYPDPTPPMVDVVTQSPGALPGKRAPVPRWAPSTLPAQSGRRRVRSGRSNPVAGSSAERLQGRSQKVGHFSIILFSRRAL